MSASPHPASATVETHATDILVIGWGLAGLVAASEAAASGRKVIIVDQEPRTNLGGQAFWSFGGLFLIDSPEQRRLGISDSLELARQYYPDVPIRGDLSGHRSFFDSSKAERLLGVKG